MSEPQRQHRPILVVLSSHWVAMLGVALVTLAGFSWLVLLASGGRAENPYVGILTSLVVPAIFFGGLILIPIGVTLGRKNLPELTPTNRGAAWRRAGIFFAVMTFVNIVIASNLSYSAVNYMDSTEFCGLTCHNVMRPEYTSHKDSPHSRVDCAACHIGAGASWFVRSKLSGTRQVFAVLLNNYPRPIPSPVANLRPARETCEQCHWPQRFTGDKVMVHTTYAQDESNSATTTVLLLKVGGRAWNGTVGIHGAHLKDKATIDYISTDEKRQNIPQVTYTAPDGKQTIYKATDAKITPEELAKGQHRTMDCVDCHNRPTHTMQMPDRALDDALSSASISPKLPFIKKQALAALKPDYPDNATGDRKIAEAIENFYKNSYPQTLAQDRKLVDGAVAAIQAIYDRNVFPEMKVTWGTYPNNIGHMDNPGCFRCHDGSHTSAEGKTIPNACDTCHELKAVEEKNPQILSDLGIVPGAADAGH